MIDSACAFASSYAGLRPALRSGLKKLVIFSIQLLLNCIKLVIEPLLRQQFRVSARFNNASTFHRDYFVRITNCRKSVGNDDCGASFD